MRFQIERDGNGTRGTAPKPPDATAFHQTVPGRSRHLIAMHAAPNSTAATMREVMVRVPF